MACMCGDPYCSSCGPAQGYFKCEHGMIYGDCEIKECNNYCGEEEIEDINEAIDWSKNQNK